MKPVFILIIFIIPFFGICAHPHMMIFSSCSLEFNEDSVEGLWIEFEFDRFFGAEVIWGYDEDRNEIFDEEETENLYNGAFSSLKDYNYFTFIRVGDKRVLPDRVESFSARCEGPEILIYRFFIPLDNFSARDFFVSTYDATFFCAVRYQEEYFDPEIDSNRNIQFDLESNTAYPVYYNPNGAVSDKTTYDKSAPGLQTFIPEEIHITY